MEKCEACNRDVSILNTYSETTGHDSNYKLKTRLVCGKCYAHNWQIPDMIYRADQKILDCKRAFLKGLREGLKLKNVKQS